MEEKRQIAIKEKRIDLKKFLIYILTASFTICILMGNNLKISGTICISSYDTLLLQLSLIIFFSIGGGYVLQKIFQLKMKIRIGTYKKTKFIYMSTWLGIILFYLPIWLAFYPGIAAYDSNIQIQYVMEQSYSNHHPLLHTLLLGGMYKLGTEFGSRSMGINWYAFIQLLVMSAIFSYAIYYLIQRQVNKIIVVILFLFYALYPVNSILSISATKDVLFSGVVLLFVLLYLQVWEEDKQSFIYIIEYVVISILMLMLRNNMLYTWVVVIPLLFLFSSQKQRFFKVHFCTIILYFILNSCLMSLLDVEKSSPVEFLSVPSQQMARVAFLNEEVQTNTEIKKYIPRDTIENYNPYLADHIKFHMNSDEIRGDIKGFVKLWIELGINYPEDYIDAFLLNCSGFWYISDISHATIYGENVDGIGYLMDKNFYYNNKPIGEENPQILWLNRLYHNLWVENEYLNIPGLRYLFVPAIWIWLLLGVIVWGIYSGRREKYIPGIFLLIYYTTLLLGPACLIRYIYPLVVSVPMILAIKLTNKKTE